MSHFQGHLAVGVLCVIQQSLEQHNPSRCEHLSHVSIHLLPAHAFIVAQLSAQRNKLVCKLTLGPSETETVGIIVRENIPRQHLAHRHGHGRGVDEFARYRQKLTWFFWDAKMSNYCGCKHSVGSGNNLRPRGRQPRIVLLRCVALVDAVCTSSTVSAGLEKFRVKA